MLVLISYICFIFRCPLPAVWRRDQTDPNAQWGDGYRHHKGSVCQCLPSAPHYEDTGVPQRGCIHQRWHEEYVLWVDWYQVCVSCHCQTDFILMNLKSVPYNVQKLKNIRSQPFPFTVCLDLSTENCSAFKLLGDSLFHTLLFAGLRLPNKSAGIEREHDQSVFSVCVCLCYSAQAGLGFLTSIIVMRKELVLTRF